jgi:type I restriction enzyme R subunit
LLIKDEPINNLIYGDTLGIKDAKNKTNGFVPHDGHPEQKFHYMLANPPFGVEWKPEEDFVREEYANQGFSGRFGAGLPRINDGSLLFLQHMISKMHNPPRILNRKNAGGELPERFGTEEYQILLVAEKYQTGFDQPLLHSMYVDKRLSGIQAVQTLSRLNRTMRGKTDTFVLDFVNTREEIYTAFKSYYEFTPQGEDTDPQQLNTLAHTLANWKVFITNDVNAWCEIWFRNRMNPTGGEHKQLNSLLDAVVERFKDLGEEDQNLFKGQLVSFRNLYSFVSQIIPYQDSDHEKLYTYARFLLTKLPLTADRTNVQVDDEVELQYYRLQKISEGAINLKVGEPEALYGSTAVGTGQADEEVQLSTLVSRLNERFGTEFTPADQLFFDQVRETAVANEQLRQAVLANSIENFEPVFNKQLENLFIERIDGNEDIFVRLMNDEAFKSIAANHLMRAVYQQVRASAGEVSSE